MDDNLSKRQIEKRHATIQAMTDFRELFLTEYPVERRLFTPSAQYVGAVDIFVYNNNEIRELVCF